MLADTETSIEAKTSDFLKAIRACEEALRIYCDPSNLNAKNFVEEYAETQMLLWAAYSGLAEIEDRAKNTKKAIDACLESMKIYEKTSQYDYADAKKSLGYSYMTLANIENKAKNCHQAILAYKSALEYYTFEKAPLEHADILRDLAYANLALSEVEDMEENGKKALKTYKKAFNIFSKEASQREKEGDPTMTSVRDMAEKCHSSMDSCKRILKISKRTKKDLPSYARVS
jgi:tetratricopeptide (TPR) repeat protein